MTSQDFQARSRAQTILETMERIEQEYARLNQTHFLSEQLHNAEESFKYFEQQQEAIEKQWQQLFNPAKHIQEYLNKIIEQNNMLLNNNFHKELDERLAIHDSWKATIERDQKYIDKLISDSIGFNLKTEALFIKNNIAEISESFILKEFQERTFNDFFKSYTKLTDSFESMQCLLELPQFILPISSRENWLTNLSLSYLHRKEPDLDNKDRKFIEAECQVVRCEFSGFSEDFQDIANMILGAKQALISTTIETTRHVLISLRESFTHLLHRLAPDELVIQWGLQQQSPEDYLHENRPTRKARLLYICKEVSHGPLVKFFEKDIAATLELINIFQHVHESKSSLTPSQLKCIIAKTESAISFIIKVSREKI
jgi:hypothetical protein